MLDDGGWDYGNAYAIYDYISYQNAHNTTAASLLAEPDFINPATNISYLDTLRYLADEQQFAQLGNMNAPNEWMDEDFTTGGSISTIAGNMLASKMLTQLQINIQSAGEFYKLSVLFSDFEPLMSFFALTDLPPLDSHFYGIPNFASVAAIELFSYTTNDTRDTYPAEDDLWVRFLFRNGTDTDAEFKSYPLFNHGPSNTDVKWTDFQVDMYGIMLSNMGDWCTQCGAQLLFCAAWNTTLAMDSSSEFTVSGSPSRGGVSPAVGGVIGAVVTLVIAGLLFALAMFFGGVRLHRVQKGHKSELGGFKGGQRMRSDQDLTIPKGGAVVGATVVSPTSPVGGHERVGSWELKGNEAGLPNIAGAHEERRPSFEEDDVLANPFRDPVKVNERV